MTRIASLPLFHQIAGQPVLVLGDGPAAEPKRRLVERAGGVVVDDMARAIDEGVRLAFVAYEDARACEVAAINLRCAGLLVNVVDRPELCDFTTPSILDRDPLLVAIGTGGASAGLAKHVRLRLERILPASLGLLARALEGVRGPLREALPDGAARRRVLDAALAEGGPLDPLDGASHERVAAWLSDGLAGQFGSGPAGAPVEASKGPVAGAGAGLSDGETRHPARTIELVLTSPDPDDLTLRQARLLGEAEALLLDGAVPDPILARARADAARLRWNSADQNAHEGSAGLTLIVRYRSAG